MKTKILFLLVIATFLSAAGAQELESIEDKAKLGLARSYVNLKQFNEAVSLLEELHSSYSQNNEITLELARVLSWDRQYDESLKLYDKLIHEQPDPTIYKREKARVLGWARRYKESIEEYTAIDQDSDVSKIEMQAKKNYYDIYDARAARYYESWLDKEPENLEALFDLAQLNSRQMQWEKALSNYDKVLSILPNHSQAKVAINKAKMYSDSLNLKTGFKLYESDSASRTVDKRYTSIFAQAKLPLNNETNLTFGQDNTFFSFSGVDQVYRQRFDIGLEYNVRPGFWLKSYYQNSLFSDSIENSHNFGTDVFLSPDDPWLINFSHKKQDVIENYNTLNNHLQRDDYKTRITYRPNRRLTFGSDYMNSQYNDGNRRDSFGADFSYYVFYEPRSLKLIYRYQQYNYSKLATTYFSPDSFHSNMLSVQWREYLNDEEMFWGTNDTYYTIRYSAEFEPKEQIGHRLFIDFHHDWNDNCSSHFEWSKLIYEHSEIYSEERLMFYTSFYF